MPAKAMNARVLKLEQATAARIASAELMRAHDQGRAAANRLMSYLPAYRAALELDWVASEALGEDMDRSEIFPWARKDPRGRAVLAKVLWHERVLIQREKNRPVAKGTVRPAELCGLQEPRS